MISIALRLFVLILFFSRGFALPWPDQGDWVRDCRLPDPNHEGLNRSCLLGHGFLEIPTQEFTFQPETPSFRAMKVTTFSLSYLPIRKFEVLAWLGSTGEDFDPELREVLTPPYSDIAFGLNAKEADLICRFMGGKVPTEAEAEAAHQNFRRFENAEVPFFTRDSYRDILPEHYKGTNPEQIAVNHRATIRDLKTRKRQGLARHLRYDQVSVRCSYRDHPVWNMQKSPQVQDPIVIIVVQPENARLHVGEGVSHWIGQSPVIRRVPGGKTRLTAIAPTHEPKTVHIDLPQGSATEIRIDLRNPLDLAGQDLRRDGIMRLIPAGPLNAGSTDEEKQKLIATIRRTSSEENLSTEQIRKYLKPTGEGHTVWLPSFSMDQTEVSVKQYWDYVAASGAEPPRCHRHDDESRIPVTCINWTEAQAYCRYYNLDLPTEMQWEKAAEGLNGLVEHASWERELYPVGGHPMDVSRYGIRDLNGNAMEWTQDWFDPDYFLNPRIITLRSSPLSPRGKTVRGASGEELRIDRSIQKRRAREPLSYARDLGFRCVKNAP